MEELIKSLDKKLDEKFKIMEENIDKKFDEKFKIMEENMEKKFDKKLAELEDKFEKRFTEMKKEILDKQFVFEQSFGQKIDMIYDAVTLELDKNIEKSQKIRRLDERMDNSEARFFNHEKRISSLERKI